MTNAYDHLSIIVARKRREVARRHAHATLIERALERVAVPLHEFQGGAALRRSPGTLPRVIAELKFRSPSAGCIRARRAGEIALLAKEYVENGATAVSVVVDTVSFGGSTLDVRRVAEAVKAPILFKEFVVDEIQIRLARALGASFVLLIVRALDQPTLQRLVSFTRMQGMEPLVEIADPNELGMALATDAEIVGVNARDLRTFEVDRRAALKCIDSIPSDRVAIFMSGIRSPEDLKSISESRADAVLIGEELMASSTPGKRLKALLEFT